MAPPNLASTGSIGDGGLGVLPSDDSGIVMKIGPCSLGVAGTIYSFRGTAIATVIATLGKGKLVDDLIGHLIKSGGKTTRVCVAAASTAGTNSAVTQVGSGPLVTLTTTPDDDYNLKVVILLGGAIGTATFKYSLDGGDSYSGTIVTAATYLTAAGTTLNFTAGTYVLDTTYTAVLTAPAMTVGDVAAALDIANATALSWEFFHVVGNAATAAAAATMAATLTTKITAAHTVHRWIWGVMEAPPVTSALLIASFTTYTDRFLMLCGGWTELTSDRSDVPTALQNKRNSARVIVPRLARNPISIHPAQNATDNGLDPVIPDGAFLVPTGNVSGDASGYYNENVTGTLNGERIATLRTIDQYPGVYVSNVPMLAAATSDLQSAMECRVVLKAAQLFYAYSLPQLGRRIGTNANGTIRASFAQAIDDDGTAYVKNGLSGQIQNAQVLVLREDVIATTQELRAKVRVKAWDRIFTFNWEVALTSALPNAA